jgi:acetamidase/formamidase
MNLFLKTWLCLCAAIALPAAAQQQPVPDVKVRSTPQSVVWGFIPSQFPPIMRVNPGQVVEIDTVSHQGMMLPKVDPVTFFGKGGVQPEEVLKDVTDIYGAVRRDPAASAHVLTGPIYIEGAEPGDMLEIRVIDVKHRVPYGANTTNKGTGVLPELHHDGHRQRPQPRAQGCHPGSGGFPDGRERA